MSSTIIAILPGDLLTLHTQQGLFLCIAHGCMVSLLHSNRKPVVWCESKLDTAKFVPLFSKEHAVHEMAGVEEASNLQWMEFLTWAGQSSLQHSRHMMFNNQPCKWYTSSPISCYFTLIVKLYLKNNGTPNRIIIKNVLYQNMAFVKVTVGCTQERTRPLVGCLKRALHSSKQNQIKTSDLQTVEKKAAPAQSNVKWLATWKQKLSKELWEALTKFMSIK